MSERMDERELEGTLSDIGARLEGPRRDMWPAVRERIVGRRPVPWWRVGLERVSLAPVARWFLCRMDRRATPWTWN